MRKRTLIIGSAIVAAAIVTVPTVAQASNGGAWLLGRSNTESAETKVTSSGGTPLNLVAKSGYAPLKVNSSKVVTNLNADRLDGLSGGSYAKASARSGIILHDGSSDNWGAKCPAGSIATGGGGYDPYGYPVAYSGPDYDASTGAVVPNSWLALDEYNYVLVSFVNCTNVTGGSIPGAVTNHGQFPSAMYAASMSAPQGLQADGSVDLPAAKEKGAKKLPTN